MPTLKTRRTFGVVLAGGQSKRMGQDKAALRHASGQTWLSHSVALLRLVCTDVFISSNQLILLDVPTIVDSCTHAGPAAAIVDCLRQLPAVDVLFVPVDLPHLTSDALDALLQSGDADDAVHFAQHRLPLLLRHTPAVERRIQSLSAPQNVSIRELLDGLNVCVVPSAPYEHALINANQPTDYQP